jgi:hypothetical protein
VALAPSTFGAFGGDILVGKVEIDGLWGLRFAPVTPGPGPNTLSSPPASTTKPTA